MRKLKLTLTSGGDAGAIIEQEDGKLTGEGRGANLVRLVPDKPFDYWVQQLPHSKSLTFEVVEE